MQKAIFNTIIKTYRNPFVPSRPKGLVTLC